MPEVAKTLPDPLQTPTVDPGPNADEILSQLAGEEIDRLLAEADAPRNQPVVPIAPVPESPVATAVEPPVVAKAGGTFRLTQKAPAPDPAADLDLSKQLDDLFNELNQEIVALPAAEPSAAVPAPPTVAPEPAPKVVAEPSKPIATEVPQAVAADPAQDTSLLEESVLAATELVASEMAATELAAQKAPAEKTEVVQPVPAKPRRVREPLLALLLRPVARISSMFSETTLDWMGKVAILTTVNAMLIFAYLLLRKH